MALSQPFVPAQVPVFVIQGPPATRMVTGSEQGRWSPWLSEHTASGKVAAAVLRFPAGSGDFVVGMERSALEHLSLWPPGAPAGSKAATELSASGQFRMRRALSGRGLREVRTGGATEHRSLQPVVFPAQALGLLAAAASWAVGRAAVSVAVLEERQMPHLLLPLSRFRALCTRAAWRATLWPASCRTRPWPRPSFCQAHAGRARLLRHSCDSLRRCRSQGGPLACACAGIALGQRPSKFCANASRFSVLRGCTDVALIEAQEGSSVQAGWH